MFRCIDIGIGIGESIVAIYFKLCCNDIQERLQMKETIQTEKTTDYVMTEQSIDAYIQHDTNRGASKDSIHNYKRVTSFLFDWLPGDRHITKVRWIEW